MKKETIRQRLIRLINMKKETIRRWSIGLNVILIIYSFIITFIGSPIESKEKNELNESAEEIIELAFESINNYEYDKALEKINHVLIISPNNQRAKELQQRFIVLKASRVGPIVGDEKIIIEKWIEKNPDDYQARIGLIHINHMLSNYKEMIEQCDYIIDKLTNKSYLKEPEITFLLEAIYQIGIVHSIMGKNDEFIEDINKIYNYANLYEDKYGIALYNILKGILLKVNGDYKEAEKEVSKANAYFIKENNLFGQYISLYELIKLYDLSNNFNNGYDKINEAIKIANKLNSGEFINTILKTKLSFLRKQGKFSEAISLLNDIFLKSEFNNKPGDKANMLLQLGNLYNTNDEFLIGEKKIQQAIDLYIVTENKLNLAFAYNAMGHNQIGQNKKVALEYLKKSKTIFREINFKIGILYFKLNTGIFYMNVLKQYDRTIKIYEELLLEIHDKIEFNALKAQIFAVMGIAYREKGNFPEAEEYLYKAISYSEDDQYTKNNLYKELCLLYLVNNNYEKSYKIIFESNSYEFANKDKITTLYLQCILNKLMNKNSTYYEGEFQKLVVQDFNLYWPFVCIDNWLKELTNEEQKIYISNLTNKLLKHKVDYDNNNNRF